MRFDLRDLPMVGIAVALLGLLAFGGVIAREVRHQAAAREGVSNRLSVLLALQAIETGVAASESELRGYALSRDPAFFDDFDENVASVLLRVDEVRGLTRDDPAQQRSLDLLDPVIAQRLDLLREGQGGLLAGLQPVVPPPEALPLTREIGAIVQTMRNAELQELDVWRETARQRMTSLVGWGRFGALTGVGGGLVALWWIARERRVRRANEEAIAEKRAIVDTVLESTTDAVFAKGLDGRYLMMNTPGARFLGRGVSSVVGKRDDELFAEATATANAERDLEVLRAAAPRSFESVATANGVSRTFHTTLAPFRDADGQVTGLVGISRDVSERKALEETRFREMTLLLELAEMFQACRSPVEAYAVISRMGARLFPMMSGGVSLVHPSRNLVELRASWGPRSVVDGDGLFAPDDCWALRRGRPHVAEGDYGMACRHGAGPGATCCTPLLAQGEVLGVLHVGADGLVDPVIQRRAAFVAEQISMAIANLELRETLRTQSIRDPLTGLYNRRFTEDTLRRELLRASRHHGNLAVLVMDLDHFKRINDTFGHDAGDKVLREVGAVMMEATRSTDDVASRVGGEELVVVLPGLSAEEVWRKAEGLRARIAALDIPRDGVRIGPVTVSIGIAMYPAHGRTVDELMKSGDTALYAAKRTGRNRVVWAECLSDSEAAFVE